MTCKELTGFLDDYLAGELPMRKALGFRLHLALCSACRKYVRGYRDTIRLAKGAFGDPEGDLPKSVPRALIAAILAAQAPDTGSRSESQHL